MRARRRARLRRCGNESGEIDSLMRPCRHEFRSLESLCLTNGPRREDLGRVEGGRCAVERVEDVVESVALQSQQEQSS